MNTRIFAQHTFFNTHIVHGSAYELLVLTSRVVLLTSLNSVMKIYQSMSTGQGSLDNPSLRLFPSDSRLGQVDKTDHHRRKVLKSTQQDTNV